MCQTEKSDHILAKGKLMSTHIPESKWSEISIDFVTDLPPSATGRDSILVTVDKAPRMVHLAPCRKNITATQDHRRGGDRSQETHRRTQLSCKRQGTIPNCPHLSTCTNEPSGEDLCAR